MKVYNVGTNGQITRFNWAPAFEGKSASQNYTAEYLNAYRKLMQLIDDSPTKMVKRLAPGECLSKCVFCDKKLILSQFSIIVECYMVGGRSN